MSIIKIILKLIFIYYFYILTLIFYMVHWGWVVGSQTRTFIDMQVVIRKIENFRAENDGFIDKQKAKEIILETNRGRDIWKGKIIFHSKGDEKNFHYVLISYGSDGKPDFNNINKYYKLPKHDIRYKSKNDIVFRDGKLITNATKERYLSEYPELGIRKFFIF